MNKFGWFSTGMATMSIFVTILLSINNLIDTDKRIKLYISSLILIGCSVLFLKDKKKELQ